MDLHRETENAYSVSLSTFTKLTVLFRCRVIQMIDENKEQLRNLFRNYNVLDVQPAVTVRAAHDMTSLQVMHHWLA